MRKTNILMVSIVAMMAAGAARADIASTTYVNTQLQPVETHMADAVKHITADERTAWNAKEDESNKEKNENSYDATSTTKYPSMLVAQKMATAAAAQVQSNVNGKVAISQGSGNKNKAMITDNDGDVIVGTIATGMIDDNAVTTGKIANGTILSEDIADSTIAKGKLASGVQTSLTAADNALPAETYNTQVGTVNATNMGTTAATIVAAIKELSDNKQNKQIAAAGDAGKAVVVGSDGKMTISDTALGTAAYTSSDAYDAAGAATEAEGRVNATIGTLPNGQSTVVGYIGSVAGTAGTAVQTVKVNNEALTETDGAVNVAIVEGSTDGAISVNGTAVPVHGLGSAAYENTTAFDAAGTASGLVGTLPTNPSTNAPYTTVGAALSAANTSAGNTYQAKSTGVSVGGANGAWNALTEGSGISISTSNGKTTIATSTTYVPMPAAEENITGKAVLTYDSEANNGAGAYYWEGIGR